MKFVALVSGGKDSCFNISYCQQNGHELVAAASLRPQDGIEELDSFLYQTVGQDAIEYIGQALGVPLYRRVISGSAIETGLDYGTRVGVSESQEQNVDGDETEDLFSLLQDVKAHHPEIEGVSVGAILSNYQRTRVEHVCRRLKLTSLSYLWQRDQGELLQEMIDAGLNAIIIKVAGIGLKPQHLGSSLATMQPLLQKLNLAFGSHICGEGGEYETFTLDCPAFVKRLTITEKETVIYEDKDFATVAFLRMKSVTLEDKEADTSIMTSLSPPPILDKISEKVYASALDMMPSRNAAFGPHPPIALYINRPSKARLDKWVSIGNISSPGSGEQTIEEETQECFQMMKDMLAAEGLELKNVIHINALLASIDDFAAFNGVYSTMFGTAPPSRACVAVNLAPPAKVILECWAFEDASPRARFSLHVQGISYWAPANIGPYSQAIHVDDLSFISGQIGLIPRTMDLPTPVDIEKEVSLSLQHIRRIKDALPAYGSANGFNRYLGFIVWTTLIDKICQIAAAVRTALGSDDKTPSNRRDASIIFVIPSRLPKGAAVEIQTIISSRSQVDTEAPEAPESNTPLDELGTTDWWIEQRTISPGRTLTQMWFTDEKSFASMKSTGDGGNAFSVRIFHTVKPGPGARAVIDRFATEAATTLIPVNGIFRSFGQAILKADYAVVVLAMSQEGKNPASSRPYVVYK